MAELTSLPIRFKKEDLMRTNSIVGRGQFAIPYLLGRIEIRKGDSIWRNNFWSKNKNTPILYKSVNINDKERCFKALRGEINILEDLRPNPHILNLVGTCLSEIKNREIYLAFEFCGNGNLLKYIRHCNPCTEFEFDTIRSMVTHTESGPVLTLTRYRLLQWSHEIASGMEYLASKDICHNDLAARNILVTFHWNTKICNFALAHKLHSRKPVPHDLPMEVLPIKWMAPEAIRGFKYSEKSDVWSLGVTLWEIYSLGEIPYRDWKVENDFWKTLLRSERLEKPRYAHADVWEIMLSCWEFHPEKRPTFTIISEKLKELKQTKKGKGTLGGRREILNRSINMNKLLKPQQLF